LVICEAAISASPLRKHHAYRCAALPMDGASPAGAYGSLILRAVNAETPPLRAGFLDMLGSLTITYFHTGIRTIIGVESFHGPVRDGKGWDRLAMVIRHDLLSYCSWSNTTNPEEVAERMPLGITLGCACTAQH
jgi:hypothetical protein